jgi:deazaflavin-dependent oxidoreductase (nitroreductase family)
MRRIALSTALVAFLGIARAVEPPLPEIASALARIKSRSTIDLTTTGRKTGKEHTRPVWFVVLDDRIVVQAGKKGKTDWYENLQKNPAANVRQGDYRFRVHAHPVDDPARVDAIHKLFLSKYTSAWLLSFFGSSIGRGRPVELEPLAVAIAH